MVIQQNRSFNCKNEELPVISRFTLFSLKRDQTYFADYSPIFGEEYIAGYENQIAEVNELIQPKNEMTAQKVITDRLHTTIDSLTVPVNHLIGYINLCYGELKITPESYGLTALKKSIRVIDPEGVMHNLNLIIANNNKYGEVLAGKGFKPELAARFTDAAASIAADKQAQYEMMSNRKLIVQNNMGMLNALNDTLTQVMAVGKILFAGNDPAKEKEYTFAQLLKLVHRTSKPDNGNADEQNTPSASEPQ